MSCSSGEQAFSAFYKSPKKRLVLPFFLLVGYVPLFNDHFRYRLQRDNCVTKRRGAVISTAAGYESRS